MNTPVNMLLESESKRDNIKILFCNQPEDLDEILEPIYENPESKYKAYVNIHDYGKRPLFIYIDNIYSDDNSSLDYRKAEATCIFKRSFKSGLNPIDGLYYSRGERVEDPAGTLRSHRGIYQKQEYWNQKNKILIDGYYLDPNSKNPEELNSISMILKEHELASKLSR